MEPTHEPVSERIARENEALKQFAADTEQYLTEVAGNIRNEFTGTLNQLLTEALPSFQREVQQSLASIGLSGVGESLAGLLSGVLESGKNGNPFAAVLDVALSGALTQFARTGTLDPRSIFKAGYFAGGRAVAGNLRLSRAQRGALSSAELSRSGRNL